MVSSSGTRTEDEWFEYWKEARMAWWRRFANHRRTSEPMGQRARSLCEGCYDVEYLYPWGWDELEGIANHGL